MYSRIEIDNMMKTKLIEGNSYPQGILVRKYQSYALFKNVKTGLNECFDYVDLYFGGK